MATIWTVGHSNVTFEVLLERLQRAAIERVADVRRYPMSRRHPQFGQVRLAASLQAAGIEYAHFPELGGHRQPAPESPNTAWRNEAFRGYADYMETPEFEAGLERLLDLSRDRRTAVMCAEAHWTNCHRGLIADRLKATRREVVHITDRGLEPHPYTAAARIVDGRLSYQGLL